MWRQAIVASAVAYRARFHATYVVFQASCQTTIVRGMGSLSDKRLPVSDAIDRFLPSAPPARR